MMTAIEIYSDGSATTADKDGGWAYVIVIDGKKHSEGSGHLLLASNNDAEMAAATEGLRAVKSLFMQELDLFGCHGPGEIIVPPSVTLISDSELILGWVTGKYSFRQENKMDKFRELQLLVQLMNVQTRWVRGHGNSEHNNRCDKLANAARLGTEVQEKKLKSKIGGKDKGIMCIWYGNTLKIIDLDNNTVEDHNESIHGNRSSRLEHKKD